MLAIPIFPLPLSGPRRLNFTVRELSGGHDRRRFVRTAANVYRGDRYWAPGIISERLRSLDPKKNPGLAHIQLGLFAAESRTMEERIGAIAVWAGEPAGAIRAASRVAFFGMFEVINEEEVAGSLFEAAQAWALEHLPEAGGLRGPMELDPFRSPGLLVDGFNHRPGAFMPYSLPYYPELIETAGYQPATELLAYRVDLSAFRDAYGGAARLHAEAEPVRAGRVLAVRDLERRADWRAILPEAEEGPPRLTWRVGPESPALTTSELLLHLKWVTAQHPAATILAVCTGEDGDAIAFGVAVPNTRQPALAALGTRVVSRWIGRSQEGNRMASRSARKAGIRLMPAIVRTDCLDWGLEAPILYELLSRAARQGYTTAELSPVPAGDPAAGDRLAALGASPSKTYAIYEKRF